MAVRINLAGQIVAQLGSRPTGAQSNGIGAGYQFTQSLDAGNHFWIATLRTVSVSRLPPERARAFGVLDLSRGEQPVDLRFFSRSSPTRPHRFSIVQFQLPKGTYQITCGVLVDLQFRAGQTAYVEAIAKLESLIYIPPPATAAGETVTRRAGDDFVHGLLAELEPRAVDEEVVDGLD